MRPLPRNQRKYAAPVSALPLHAWPRSAQSEHPESSGASLPRCHQRPRIQDIRRIGGVASPSLLDDYGIPFRDHFSPAFLSITFSVPGASSLPSLPGTVITNASSGCLKCRWLPLDRISAHPCFSSKRITSRTFMGISLMVRHRGGRVTHCHFHLT